ncbi:MAG: HNH endonuclease, partial [Planctomycetaceae bacterium]|nr:HNH endonuclease [Planctomycetaceae bacterium]
WMIFDCLKLQDPSFAGREMNESLAEHECRCVICEHAYPRSRLTKHHLVPKSRSGTETVLTCRDCHRQIHALFSEKELERQYGTLELLLGAEALQPWITWIRKRQPRARLRVHTSHRKRRR